MDSRRGEVVRAHHDYHHGQRESLRWVAIALVAGLLIIPGVILFLALLYWAIHANFGDQGTQVFLLFSMFVGLSIAIAFGISGIWATSARRTTEIIKAMNPDRAVAQGQDMAAQMVPYLARMASNERSFEEKRAMWLTDTARRIAQNMPAQLPQSDYSSFDPAQFVASEPE